MIVDLPQRFMLRRTNSWKGKTRENIEFKYTWQSGEKYTNKKGYNYKFKMIDWAEFLGWFVSEGCVVVLKDGEYTCYQIDIANTSTEYLLEIETLLKRMGINCYQSGKGIRFINKVIGRYLLKHCGKYARNKRIPKIIKEATPEVKSKKK